MSVVFIVILGCVHYALDGGNGNVPGAHLGERAVLGHVVGVMALIQYIFNDILMNSHIV